MSKIDMVPMCTTKSPKWGYRITNPVTGTRVSVGPFVDKQSASKKMEQAHGNRKHLGEMKKFDFTPTWNGWSDDEYKGEDILTYHKMPEFN